MKYLLIFLLLIPISYADEYITFNVSLNSGWNLVTIPIQPIDNSTIATFGNCLSTLNIRPIMEWSANAFRSVDYLNARKGYWIFSTELKTCIVNGTYLEEPELVLQPGWNLIGTSSWLSKQKLAFWSSFWSFSAKAMSF